MNALSRFIADLFIDFLRGKRMAKKFIFIFLVLITTVIYGLDENELPFGAYDLDIFDGQSFEGQVDTLHDLLGFNIFWVNNRKSADDIRKFGESGMVVIRGGDSSDSLYILSCYNYARIEAEECDSKVRMYNCGGTRDEQQGLWISDRDHDILYGPNGFNPPCWGWCDNPNKYYIKLRSLYLDIIGGGIIQYRVDTRMKIDEPNGGSDSVVAILKLACEADYKALDTTVIDFIRLEDFGTDTSLVTLTSPQFNLPETVRHMIDSTIETTGIRKVSVDYIVIYDQTGKELIEGQYDANIIANANRFTSLGDTIWGWYMRDEPYFSYIPPIGHIADIVRSEVGTDWRFITALNYPEYYGYWFEQISSDLVTPDIYPFSYRYGQDSVAFTGYEAMRDRISLMVQNRMNHYMDRCRKAYYAAVDNNGEFWVIPQCFQGVYLNSAWRKPTRSELSCQTYMALAHGARGIIYWKYGKSGFDTSGTYFSGVYNTSGIRTDLWDAIVYDINPYIKAIDSTYMALSLDTAYYFSPVISPDSSVPAGAWIDTIYAVSDTPNPDLGWFQVGQFTESSDKYVMIVNRACSSNEDGDPAPDITATIKFNTSTLGLGNYVEIIDIADSVNYISYDSVLVFPDTTFTSSTDGQITYSTQFGPGEGRLFKLMKTP
jgi:hypothetical protein